MIAKLPPPPREIIEKTKFAERPPNLPRGYFDALMTPTRTLLDQGLSISNAADWWVTNGVIPSEQRGKFMEAMYNRLHRLRQRKAAEGEIVRWRASPYYESVHAIGDGLKALCGASTTLWVSATNTAHKCARCIGISRRLNISVADPD